MCFGFCLSFSFCLSSKFGFFSSFGFSFESCLFFCLCLSAGFGFGLGFCLSVSGGLGAGGVFCFAAGLDFGALAGLLFGAGLFGFTLAGGRGLAGFFGLLLLGLAGGGSFGGFLLVGHLAGSGAGDGSGGSGLRGADVRAEDHIDVRAGVRQQSFGTGQGTAFILGKVAGLGELMQRADLLRGLLEQDDFFRLLVGQVDALEERGVRGLFFGSGDACRFFHRLAFGNGFFGQVLRVLGERHVLGEGLVDEVLLLFRQRLEQRCREGLRLEGLEVVDTFAETDELDRQFEVVLDGQDHAAAGRAVEFRQHDTGDLTDVHEFLRLGDSVLAGGRVQDQEDFPVGVRQFAVDDLVDLAELCHEVFLVVDTARGVADDDVRAAIHARMDGVEHDSGRVGTLIVFDHVDACAVRPDLQLVDRRSTERVRRTEDDLASGGLEVVGHFTDGRGLADTVDADDQDDGRGGQEVDGLVLAEHVGDDLLDDLTNFGRVGNAGGLHPLLRLFDNLLRRHDTDVRHDEHFDEFLVKVLIDGLEGAEDVVQVPGKVVTGLLQTAVHFSSKQCHRFLLLRRFTDIWVSQISFFSGKTPEAHSPLVRFAALTR